MDQYTEMVFQDIIPDTSAAKVLTARKSQFKALQCKMLPEIELDITRTNEVTIYFGSGIPLNSISTVQVFILLVLQTFTLLIYLLHFFSA